MSIATQSIMRAATRKNNTRLNILEWFAHERYAPNFAQINADFYSLPGEHVRTWNTKYSEIPQNYNFVPDIPKHLEFDCIVSHNPFAHIPMAINIARNYHIPIISIFHTECPVGWTEETFHQNYERLFRYCDHHIFITEYNKASWFFGNHPEKTTFVNHAIDFESFSPGNEEEGRDNVCMSVCNDWINRDAECGYSLWKDITEGLPVKVFGDTPGLSVPANDLQHLIGEYQKAKIFVNTTPRSPTPMSVLEAMYEHRK